MRPGHQLVLEIAPRPAFGLEDFLLSPCNEAAFDFVERWPDWPDPVALIVGGEGVGKSHVATIWACRAGAQTLSPSDMRLEQVSDAPVLIDDADRIGDEAALFHLINAVCERRSSLLLTARRPPEHWPVRLPDLLSRLRRATRVEVDVPDDDLIRAVLVKLLVDRQLLVDTSVVEFIVRRIDRSMDVAREVVARLDTEGLSRGRRISRALAADVLRAVGAADNEEEAQ